jgi:hypothetical protein
MKMSLSTHMMNDIFSTSLVPVLNQVVSFRLKVPYQAYRYSVAVLLLSMTVTVVAEITDILISGLVNRLFGVRVSCRLQIDRGLWKTSGMITLLGIVSPSKFIDE